MTATRTSFRATSSRGSDAAGYPARPVWCGARLIVARSDAVTAMATAATIHEAGDSPSVTG